MHRIHSAQLPTLAPRVLTQVPSQSFGMRTSAIGCSPSQATVATLGSAYRHARSVPSTRRMGQTAGRAGQRASVRSCFEMAATAGVCRWVASAVGRRRLSTLARKAAAEAQSENLTAINPAVVTDPDAPITGIYDTIRSTDSLAVHFTSVKTLGEEKTGPAIGEEVWIRARIATVRIKGKSTFVVLRENSLYTVQACKFKDKEDGGESATAVARFFKSIPLDPAWLTLVLEFPNLCVESAHSYCLDLQSGFCYQSTCRKALWMFVESSQRPADRASSVCRLTAYLFWNRFHKLNLNLTS